LEDRIVTKFGNITMAQFWRKFWAFLLARL